MTPEQALPILDHASRASDRWLFLCVLIILGLFGAVCLRWLVSTFVGLVGRLESVLERNAEAFREVSEAMKACSMRRPGPMLFLLLGLIAALAQPPPAAAGSVTVVWNGSSESFVDAYRVYTGTASRRYSITNAVQGISNTNCTVLNLTNGVVWHFAVTAVATNGIQSDYSEEVSVDWRRPSTPVAIKIRSMTITLDVTP